MKTDITYTQNGFFTRFQDHTEEGEKAVREIYRVTGDGVIRNDHLKAVLKQLRQKGYKVTKAKKLSEKQAQKELEEIFKSELFNNALKSI